MAKGSGSNTSKEVKTKRSTKKLKKSVSVVVVHIEATFNNTKVTVTDANGNTLSGASSSAGSEGFKGSRKSTPYAAQVAAKTACQNAVDLFGATEASIIVKGPGPGKEAAAKAAGEFFKRVTSITDATPIPHNGCRAEKERRV